MEEKEKKITNSIYKYTEKIYSGSSNNNGTHTQTQKSHFKNN
jgi:hypothetical protein